MQNIAPIPRSTATSSQDKPTFLQTLETLVWVLLAACMVFYGNGEKDAIDVVLTDPRIRKPCIGVAAACAGINFVCFVYVQLYLGKVKGIPDPAAKTPVAVAVGAGTLVFGGLMLIVGIWPVWGILSPLMVFTLFMGFVLSFQFLPTFGVLRVKQS